MISNEKAEKIFNILRKDIVQDFVREKLTTISCITDDEKKELFKQVSTFYDWCTSASTLQTSCNMWSMGEISLLLNSAVLENGTSVIITINDIILDDL